MGMKRTRIVHAIRSRLDSATGDRIHGHERTDAPVVMQSSRRDIAFRISQFGGAVACVGFPVSISLSQGGLFLALTAWVVHRILLRDDERLRFEWTPELAIGISIYVVLFLSLLVNAFSSASPWAVFRKGMNDEVKDVVLLSAAFWFFSYTATEEGRKDVVRWLWIALAILLITGVVSLFSKWRLSKIPYHLTHGWENTAQARFQHHIATILPGKWDLHLYLPIGLMNTHLTYAALLCMLVPVLALRFIDHTVAQPLVTLLKDRQRLTGLLIRFFLLALSGLILAANNGRSAILGLVGALGAALVYYGRTTWRKDVLRILVPAGIAAALLAGVLALAARQAGPVQNYLAGLMGQEKPTDYQRVFVWRGAFQLARENPFFGVGPGRFEQEINRTILEFSQERPRLWYAYSVIQKGHAHNDVFHLLAVGGFLAPIVFFVFFGSLIRAFFGPYSDRETSYFRWGALVVFFGGIFQCYFQDDEVLLPIAILVGLALRESRGSTVETEAADKTLKSR